MYAILIYHSYRIGDAVRVRLSSGGEMPLFARGVDDILSPIEVFSPRAVQRERPGSISYWNDTAASVYMPKLRRQTRSFESPTYRATSADGRSGLEMSGLSLDVRDDDGPYEMQDQISIPSKRSSAR